MDASPNWIRSDKLIIYSDLRVISKWAPSTPVWTPWPDSWSPCPQPQPQPQLQPLQQTAVAVHRQNHRGLSNSKMNSRQSLPKSPRTQKLFPRPPHELKSKNKLIFWKCGPEVIVNLRYTYIYTVYLVISKPIIPYVYRIYMVLANPTYLDVATWWLLW